MYIKIKKVHDNVADTTDCFERVEKRSGFFEKKKGKKKEKLKQNILLVSLIRKDNAI